MSKNDQADLQDRSTRSGSIDWSEQVEKEKGQNLLNK